MPLVQLSSATVKLIGSSQIITSVSSAVKELFENAIDAGATNINIKLEKHGLERIEVKDDGHGISRTDTSVMCLPNYTSKITDFSDLGNLHSYGFRGEALSSLCAVAQVNITTKTAEDDIAMCYTLDNNGQVRAAKVSPLLKGTIVTVENLFKCLPVRKQLMSNSRRANEELKKVETVVKSLAVIHPRVRVTLTHNKFMIWQKTSVSNLRQSVVQVISQSIVKQLHHLHHRSELLKMEFLLPKRDCDVATVCTSTAADSSFVFINSRPVHDKKIEKVVFNKIMQYFGHYTPINKYPIFFASLTLPEDMLDVNLEPNKTKVFIINQEQVLNCIEEQLSLYYQRTSEADKSEQSDNNINNSNKRQKLELPLTADVGSNVNNSEKFQIDSTVLPKNLNNGIINEKTDISNSEGFPDKVLMPNDIETYANDVLIMDNTSTINESILQEETANDTNSNFVQNEIKNFKTGSEYFPDLPMDISEMYELEKFEIAEVITDLNKKDSALPLDKKASTVNENKRQTTLLSTFKPKSIQNIICNGLQVEEMFLEPLTIESQECKMIGKKEANILVENKNHCNVVMNSTIDSINETPTLSQWSRGEVGFDCNPIQIGKSDINEIESESNEIVSPIASSTVTDHSVASQMGRKEMAAFTKFARDMRSKILEETPGMTFTKVAGELANKWRGLHDEEKCKYEEEAAKAEKEKHQQKLQSTLKSRAQQSILHSFNKPKIKRPTIELEYTVNDIKKMISIPKDSHAKGGFGLINQLEASPLWTYYNGCDLKIISSLRLLESVTFHKHLAQIKVPIKPLEQPLHIKVQDLEPTLWNLLLSLELQNNIIIDSRITYNGFSIELIRELDTTVVITHVALNIKYYGIEDLCEILKCIQMHGINCSLMECRPLKVRNFLRNEAFRECNSKDMVSDLTSMKELLFYWLENVQPHSEVCLHDHPIAITLE